MVYLICGIDGGLTGKISRFADNRKISKINPTFGEEALPSVLDQLANLTFTEVK